MEQLLEKTKAHHTFLFPKPLCLNAGRLMTQPAGELPKASSEHSYLAEARGASACWKGEAWALGPACFWSSHRMDETLLSLAREAGGRQDCSGKGPHPPVRLLRRAARGR